MSGTRGTYSGSSASIALSQDAATATDGGTMDLLGQDAIAMADRSGITLQGFDDGNRSNIAFDSKDTVVHRAGQIYLLEGGVQTITQFKASVSHAPGDMLTLVDEGGHIGIVEAAGSAAMTNAVTITGGVRGERPSGQTPGTYTGSYQPGGTYDVLKSFHSPATITSTATIYDHGHYQAAVYVRYSASLLNEGVIVESFLHDGLVMTSAEATVINTGTIETMAFEGNAFELDGGDSAAEGGLTNSGLIEATDSFGVGLSLTGGSAANSGTIEATNEGGVGAGVALAGVLYNEARGTISGATGITFYRSTGSVVNAGTIESSQGAAGIAVQFDSSTVGATLIERSTGVLIGEIANFQQGDTIDLAAVAFSPGDRVSYASGHLIVSGPNGTYADLAVTGVRLPQGEAPMLLSDDADGTDIVIREQQPGTYSGSYVASGTYSTITVRYGAATITTTGTVDNSGEGIAVSDTITGGSLLNQGFIRSSDTGGSGVRFSASSGSFSNSGTIEAYAAAVAFLASGSVDNTGTIASLGTGYGIEARSSYYHTLEVTNAGLIEASGSIARALVLMGTAVNEGTIRALGSAGIGAAVSGQYNSRYTGEPGSFLTNASDGLISGATGVALFLTNVTLNNQGTIESSAGTNGIAVAFNSYTAGETLIEASTGVLIGKIANFQRGDTIDLTGVAFNAADHATYAAGHLTVYGAHGTYADLNMGQTTLVAGQAPFLADDGHGGTDIVIRALHAGTYTGRYTTSGTYSTINILYSPATITSSAAVLDTVYHTTAVQWHLDGGVLRNAGVIENTGSYGYALIAYGVATITNSGTIEAAGTHGIGVVLGSDSAGSSLTNTGSIEATGTNGVALEFSGAAMNAGTISSAVGFGAEVMGYHASLTNMVDGVISGETGVALFGKADTLINAGTIEATPGTGHYAVTISDQYGLIVDEAGGVFSGEVAGGRGTLELASAAAAGTISGLGSQFTNFATIEVDSGARWVLSGSNTIQSAATLINAGNLIVAGALMLDAESVVQAGGTLDIDGGTLVAATSLAAGGAGTTVDFLGTGRAELSDTAGVTIAGFAAGDEIGLTGVTFNATDRATYHAGQIELLGSGGQTLAQVAATVSYAAGVHLTVTDDGGHASIVEAVCFLAGTRILTDHGAVPVEHLAVGDRVVTISGGGFESQPIRWIGRRRINALRHVDPAKIHPVRIKRGAFADGVPERDLLVSPGHAIFAGGVLLPARRLINGVTIFQDFDVAEPQYFHIELPRHDVVLAEGLGAESYFDSGNRGFFSNGPRPVDLHGLPDGAELHAGRCAPLRNAGEQAAAVKRSLLDRVRRLGYAPGARADLRLDVDGRLSAARSSHRGIFRFDLPASYRCARLVSHWTIGDPTRAENFDARRLSVAVSAIRHHAGATQRTISLGALDAGWHGLESEAGRPFRWSDGGASLPIGGPGVLEVHVLRSANRWLRAVEASAVRSG